MKVTEKVYSTVKPKSVEFDSNHVYVHENIVEVPDSERAAELEQLEEGQELSPLYQYKTTEYDKDEFLQALSTGQVNLNGSMADLEQRATDIEDMILELSGAVYA